MRAHAELHCFLLMASLTLTSACGRQQPEAQQPQPPYQPVATVKDLMESILDPSADVVWNAVRTVVDKSGTVERAPTTDEEWTTVRRGAIRLIEGSNLLMMPGRHVAGPGEKSSTPGVELEPAQMEALIDKDRTGWFNRAKALHDVSMEALRAIEAKNAQQLMEVGERIDLACEGCHKSYWYPNEKLPPLPKDAIGVDK